MVGERLATIEEGNQGIILDYNESPKVIGLELSTRTNISRSVGTKRKSKREGKGKVISQIDKSYEITGGWKRQQRQDMQE